jgi:hypothetical protein
MPVVQSGLCEIRADGLEVGRAERLWKRVRGRSFPAYHAEMWARPRAEGEFYGRLPVADRVSGPTLRELKVKLQRRLDSEGPWWK